MGGEGCTDIAQRDSIAGDGRSDSQWVQLTIPKSAKLGTFTARPLASSPFVAEKSGLQALHRPFFAVMPNKTNSLQSE